MRTTCCIFIARDIVYNSNSILRSPKNVMSAIIFVSTISAIISTVVSKILDFLAINVIMQSSSSHSEVAPAPLTLLHRQSSAVHRPTSTSQQVSAAAATVSAGVEELIGQRRTGLIASRKSEAWSLGKMLTGEKDLLDGVTLEEDLGKRQ